MEDNEEGSPKVEQNVQIEPLAPCDPNDASKPAPFVSIVENEYITDRITSKEGKRNKRMMCDCQFDPETDDSSEACGENCLNRLLMIECGSRCPCGEYCNNRRFQRADYKPVEVFKTELKGWGLKCSEDIQKDSFVMEYCGEVCTPEEFELRRKNYELDKRRHYYFMSLKTDEIIDATIKGNLSRFINHSCDPNCETQKWTVSGKLRVGFFALRNIPSGEELTFDYQFQRFGEAAQRCYCGSSNCRGFLGVSKDPPRDMATGDSKPRKTKIIKSDANSIFEREVYDIAGSNWRLKNEGQVLALSRLMLRADNCKQRTMLLKVIQSTSDGPLKRFLSLHGLELIWSWMVELSDSMNQEALETKQDILVTLNHLPIPNKNMLNNSKVFGVVKKWAEAEKPKRKTDDLQLVISEADCSGQVQEETNKEVNERVVEDSPIRCEPTSIQANKDYTPANKEDNEGIVKDCPLTQANKEDNEGIVEDHPLQCDLPTVLTDENNNIISNRETNEGAIGDSPREREPEATLKTDENNNIIQECEEVSIQHQLKTDLGGNLTPPTSPAETTSNGIGLLKYSPVDSCSSSLENITKMELDFMNEQAVSGEQTGLESGNWEGVVKADVGVVSNMDDLMDDTVDDSVGVTNDAVGVSCEAEARYDDSRDESLFDSFKQYCHKLLEKWDQLEEVFKIPKKKSVVQSSVSSSVLSKRERSPIPRSPNSEEDPIPPDRKRFKRINRWDTPSPQHLQYSMPPQTHREQLYRPKASSSGNIFRPSMVTPQVGSFPPVSVSNIVRPPPLSTAGGPSLMGAPPPLHNTVTIVQQPTGQSLYVQQQIFTPATYIPPVTMTTRVEPYISSQQPLLPTIPHPTVCGPGPAAPLFPFLTSSNSSSLVSTTINSAPFTATETYSHPNSQTVPLPPPPAPPNPTPAPLPPNWKEAKDSSGKVYYYHAITRETQWDHPGSVDDGGTVMMDLETSSSSSSTSGDEERLCSGIPLARNTGAGVDKEMYQEHSPVGHPHTPDESPPTSDDFDSSREYLHIASPLSDHEPQSDDVKLKHQKSSGKRVKKKSQTPKDKFRHSLSKLIVRCLDHHRKADCKYGRITCAEDFKHLARKLTFGLTEKEMNRKGDSNELVFTESVKSRVKDYIKNYMKKCGPVYKRTAR